MRVFLPRGKAVRYFALLRITLSPAQDDVMPVILNAVENLTPKTRNETQLSK